MPDGAGDGAGDRMPQEWNAMQCDEIWSGLFKGELRPPPDIKAAKKMLETKTAIQIHVWLLTRIAIQVNHRSF